MATFSKSFKNAMVAFLVMLCVSTSVLAQEAYDSLIDSTYIKNPTELAAAIEESLKLDPKGDDSTPQGMNATPNGLFKALKAIDGAVSDINDLPRYYRSLVKGPVPQEEMHLARQKVGGDIDIVEGTRRYKFDENEEFYYEADASGNPILSKFVYASHCGNIPIRLQISITEGQDVIQWVDATPVSVPAAVCPRSIRIHFLASEALDVKDDRGTAVRNYVGVREGDGTPYDAPVSGMFGKQFADGLLNGSLHYSSKSISIKVEMISKANGGKAVAMTDGYVLLTQSVTLSLPGIFKAGDEIRIFVQDAHTGMAIYPQGYPLYDTYEGTLMSDGTPACLTQFWMIESES